ncbi:MAG: glutamate 5-kinase, partial [Alphaproteobacteria bacterium]|nr:glutamate 5-kinase [Alphaproteobacteria bacterium]
MSRSTKSSVRPEWQNARRIVVKIGSALLTEHGTGALKTKWLASILEDVSDLRLDGKEVVLVSSGAVALGRGRLDLPNGPLKLKQSQAAAAVGQITLAHAYQQLAGEHGMQTAQVLLTLGDTEERRRYLNARHTLQELLLLGVLPVINENDTVASAEIRYGDNDRLSARVAAMVSADCLVLLSDVDGLYTAPPDQDPTARHIPVVDEITPEIEEMAGDAGTELSKGGMKTKIEAGRVARVAGLNMVISSGHTEHPLAAIANGAKCTWFLAPSDPVTAKKQWIASQLEPAGDVVLDSGAAKALAQGKSLLPAGMTKVSGQFDRGDAVIIRADDGRELGRGLAGYN